MDITGKKVFYQSRPEIEQFCRRRRSKIETTGRLTFPGGLHPPEYKEITEDCSIQTVPVPGQVSVLLSQHIGAICKPLVNKRDKVHAGQMIGKADAFVSSPIHSPVTGTVKDICLQSHPVLGRVMGILIDSDPGANNVKYIQADKFGSDFDVSVYTPAKILRLMSR